jgi:hypothetical protein
MKLLLRLILIPVALLLMLAFGSLLLVDSLARKAIEEGGSHALGVETSLESAGIGLFSGLFTLDGLAVANPPGFSEPEFFRLRSGELQLPLSALMEETITIPSLVLEGITIDLERNSKGTNYGQLLEHLEGITAGGSSDEPTDTSDSKTFLLQELVIRDVRANVNLLPAGGELTKMSVSVPEIRVEGLSNALTLPQLCALVVTTVVRAAANAGQGLLPDDLMKDLRGRLDGIEDLAHARANEEIDELEGRLQEKAKELGPEAEKAVEGATNKLKGLLDRR